MDPDISAELGEFLRGNDNFLLLTHEKPDGDALGSLFGLFTVLRENGKKADAFLPEQPPMRYASFVPDGIMTGTSPELDSYSWILCLDTSIADRLGVDKSAKEKIISCPLVNIDHHPDNKLFGRMNFINSESAATAEIIFRSLSGSGKMRISQKAATALLIGIVMDTGGFRFDNTKPSTFNAASDLLALDADYPRIINTMFFSQPFGFVRMSAELVLNHVRMACSGRYAWMYLSDEILKKHGVEKKDTEMLIDSLRQIEGVEIAVVFYRKDDGFKISMRSKNKKYSVGKIARVLDGGGHELAAGGFIKTNSIAEAENIVLSHVSGIFEDK